MRNRDTVIGLSGVIVGILLASSTVLTAKDIALTASLDNPVQLINGVRIQVRERSDALRNPLSVSTEPTSSSSASSVVSTSSSQGVSPSGQAAADCQTAQEMTQGFLGAIDVSLPFNIRNMDARYSLQEAAKKLEATYCPSATSSSSVGIVDNHCGQYDPQSVRYLVCTVEQAAGRLYPDPERQ